MHYVEKVSQALGYPIPFFPLDGNFHHFPADNPRKKPLWAIGTEWVYKNENFWSITCGNFQQFSMTVKINSWDDRDIKFSNYFQKKAREEQAILHAKIEQEKSRRHQEAKLSALTKIKKLDPATNHPYLEKKKIPAFKIKTHIDEKNRSILDIPIYDETGLVGFQYIAPNGFKWFSSGLKIKGSFFPLKPFKQSELVFVAEGFATAASIQMSTEYPVICAFNAGNLKPVMDTLEKINPNCWFVICADNDKIDEKRMQRPGKLYALKAKAAHKKSMVIFPWDDEEKIGDFNDLHLTEGLDAVKDRTEIDLEKIKSDYEAEMIKSGFTYYNEQGKIQYDLENLFEFFVYKSNYFFVSDINRIFVYNGTHYEAIDEHLVRQFAQNYIKPYCTKKSVINEFLDLVKRQNVQKQSILKQNDDDWIPFQNGLFNFKTKDFIPHTPKIKKFHCIPHNYEPNSTCPHWDKMLCNLLKNKSGLINQLGEFFGFALSNMSYDKFQKFVILAGSGRNGKSTVLDTLIKVLGQDNCSAIELSSLSSNRFSAIKLEHSLCNISEEEPRDCFKSTGPLKKLTGNSPIQVEEKNKPSFMTINKSKLIISYNTVPYIADLSDGMKRRMLVIPFEVNLIEQPEKMIPDIHEKLSREMSGIINFALNGLDRLISQKKFTESYESKQKIDEMIRDSNPIIEFIEESFDITGNFDDQISLDECFIEFQNFYEMQKISKRNFSKYVIDYFGSKGIGKKRKRIGYFLTGLRKISFA